MGDFLSGVLGTKSQYNPTPYQSGNPYAPETLTGALQDKSTIFNQQQALGQTLQNMIAGKGPNPAQTQFLQNIAQNQANTQGLIASQRGVNPALAARMGANAQAAAGAQAAGEAALLQQQQQRQATQDYGALLGQEQQGNLGQQGLYVQGQGNAMAANVATAQGNQKSAQGIVGGVLGGAGAALGLAKGGPVPMPGTQRGNLMWVPEAMRNRMADGGNVSIAMPPMEIQGAPFVPQAQPIDFTNPQAAPTGANQPESALAKLLKRPTIGARDPLQEGLTMFGAGLGDRLRGSPANATVAEQPAPKIGEASAIPGMAISEARGGKVPLDFKPGGKVPGHAKIKGDSLKNDDVPAMLSPGEVVVPRSVTTLPKDKAVEKGADFLAAVLARKKRRA